MPSSLRQGYETGELTSPERGHALLSSCHACAVTVTRQTEVAFVEYPVSGMENFDEAICSVGDVLRKRQKVLILLPDAKMQCAHARLNQPLTLLTVLPSF
jgi:hypothetical protein